MQRYIAIDNVCAWPNLVALPDGALAVVIFNQPCHGTWEGDVDCWASTDGGLFWRKRGTAAAHEPGTNRMNVAAGLARNGDLLVLASGWSHRAPREAGMTPPDEARVLPVRVCRSADGGATWSRGDNAFPDTAPGIDALVPFGAVFSRGDRLIAGAYGGRLGETGTVRRRHLGQCLVESADDGATWQVRSVLAPSEVGGNVEAALLPLDETRWIAAVRRCRDFSLEQFTSADDGMTWTRGQPLAGPAVSAAHLLQLADGRILLTYGSRAAGSCGIDARLSGDGGDTWSMPRRLVTLDHRDNGYPFACQRDDGAIVLVYYTAEATAHQRYHMGCLRFDACELA